jgi:hypothetical protein
MSCRATKTVEPAPTVAPGGFGQSAFLLLLARPHHTDPQRKPEQAKTAVRFNHLLRGAVAVCVPQAAAPEFR